MRARGPALSEARARISFGGAVRPHSLRPTNHEDQVCLDDGWIVGGRVAPRLCDGDRAGACSGGDWNAHGKRGTGDADKDDNAAAERCLFR